MAEATLAKLEALVPMAPVADVRRSIAFYEQLGFEVENTVEEAGGVLQWAYLRAGGAHLMLSRTESPVPSEQQTMCIYLYAADVDAYHRELEGKGLDVGPLERRFYMERGEFELRDPDGYYLFVGHT
jgi:catechol 2,3-dioxygenase-like lactoylglutathione lyase family enzyme